MDPNRKTMKAFRRVAAYMFSQVTLEEVDKRSVHHHNPSDLFTDESTYELVRGNVRYIYFPPEHKLPACFNDRDETFVTLAGDLVFSFKSYPLGSAPRDYADIHGQSDSSPESATWEVPAYRFLKIHAGSMGCVIRGTASP